MPLPNTNISVAMVRKELGAATNDVGRLCIHPNVNKWSKWKPTVLQVGAGNPLRPINELELRNVKYGLSVAEFNESDINSGVAHPVWIYKVPSGGLELPIEPYRLGDFRNYEHKKYDELYGVDFSTPLKVFFPTELLRNSDNIVSVEFIGSQTSTGLVTLKDMFNSGVGLSGMLVLYITSPDVPNEVYIQKSNTLDTYTDTINTITFTFNSGNYPETNNGDLSLIMATGNEVVVSVVGVNQEADIADGKFYSLRADESMVTSSAYFNTIESAFTVELDLRLSDNYADFVLDQSDITFDSMVAPFNNGGTVTNVYLELESAHFQTSSNNYSSSIILDGDIPTGGIVVPPNSRTSISLLGLPKHINIDGGGSASNIVINIKVYGEINGGDSQILKQDTKIFR